jgi:hypothetical protein
MKLKKDGIILGDISNYREDLAFSPVRVLFDCRPPIHDADGLFDLLYPDGHVMAINILEQIANGIMSHIVARKVE